MAIIKHYMRLRMFFLFYGCTLIAQLGGGYFTRLSVTTWYIALDKSVLTPPGAAFGIVWTALYILMSMAAERIHHRVGTLRCRALRWWLIQLVLGLLWCIVFFGRREITYGLMIILANWLATVLTVCFFYRIDRRAAWLMVPLLLWLGFASYLNWVIWLHNG